MDIKGSFPGRKADHSPPSGAEVKEWLELYLHSPSKPPWRGAQLKEKSSVISSSSSSTTCEYYIKNVLDQHLAQ
jgi:hypothetical protein